MKKVLALTLSVFMLIMACIPAGALTLTAPESSEEPVVVASETALAAEGEITHPDYVDGFGKVILYINGQTAADEIDWTDESVTPSPTTDRGSIKIKGIKATENGSSASLVDDPAGSGAKVIRVKGGGGNAQWKVVLGDTDGATVYHEGLALKPGKYTLSYDIMADPATTNMGNNLGRMKAYSMANRGVNNDGSTQPGSVTGAQVLAKKGSWVNFTADPFIVTTNADGDPVATITGKTMVKPAFEYFSAAALGTANAVYYIKNYMLCYYPANSYMLKTGDTFEMVTVDGDTYTFPGEGGSYSDGTGVYKAGETVAVSEIEYKTLAYTAEEISVCEITYVNGETELETVKLPVGDPITKKLDNIFGQVFKGWMTGDGEPITTVPDVKSITLFATYEAVTHPELIDGLGKVILYTSGQTAADAIEWTDESVALSKTCDNGGSKINGVKTFENGSSAALADDPAGSGNKVIRVTGGGGHAQWKVVFGDTNGSTVYQEGLTLHPGRYSLSYDVMADTATTNMGNNLGRLKIYSKDTRANNDGYCQPGSVTGAQVLANKGKWVNFTANPFVVTKNSDGAPVLTMDGKTMTNPHLEYLSAAALGTANAVYYIKDYAICYYPAGSFMFADGDALTMVETDGESYTFPAASGYYTDGKSYYTPGETVAVSAIEYKTFRLTDKVAKVTYVTADGSESVLTLFGEPITRFAFKDGCAFKGWKNEADEFVSVVPETDVTLTAAFEEIATENEYGSLIYYNDFSNTATTDKENVDRWADDNGNIDAIAKYTFFNGNYMKELVGGVDVGITPSKGREKAEIVPDIASDNPNPVLKLSFLGNYPRFEAYFYNENNAPLSVPGTYTISYKLYVPNASKDYAIYTTFNKNNSWSTGTDLWGRAEKINVTPDQWMTITRSVTVSGNEGDWDKIGKLGFFVDSTNGGEWYLDDFQLWFKPAEEGPVTLDTYSIRNLPDKDGKEVKGMRFAAFISLAQRELSEEYGYIIAVTDTLGGDVNNLVFNAAGDEKGTNAYGVKYVSGAAYNKATGKDVIYDMDGGRFGEHAINDEGIYFTAILNNIPAAQYKTSLTVRAYTKVGGKYYYGNAVTKSLYDVAQEYYDLHADDMSDEEFEFVDSILAQA